MRMTDGRACVLTADVGGTFIKSALFSAEGDLLPGGVVETRVNSNGTAETIARSFHAVAQQMADHAERAGAVVRAIGIGTPGPFDYPEGRFLMDHKFRAVKGIPIRPWFTDVFGRVPIRFLHDAAALMLALVNEPAGSRYGRVAVATLGTGLGFALAVAGEVQVDAQGCPRVNVYDRPYRDGIAEDYVSRRGILARYRAVAGSGEGLDVVDVAGLAHGDDANALRVFRETGAMLGEILRPVLLEHRIECLFIGGQIARAGSLFEPSLRTALDGVPSLRAVQTVSDPTVLPLRGVFLDVLRNAALSPSPTRRNAGE